VIVALALVTRALPSFVRMLTVAVVGRVFSSMATEPA